ncbi:MAG: HD domain-containing protein [Clostridia bacterium]|nr:HD domain-containing protein [Clostridia bacterium]
MDVQTFLQVMHTSERLKDTVRHSYTSGGRRESVAEHSWRLALMAYFLQDEFPDADMNKVMEMCLVHDLGECFTGDIPAFLKTNGDEGREEQLLMAWVRSLPEPYAARLRGLYGEMAALTTREAKIYKALDKMEAVLQHNEAPLSTWIPREYELNKSYGFDQAAFSPYLAALREQMRLDTERKIEESKKSP